MLHILRQARSLKLWNGKATAQYILHERTPSANLGEVKSHIHCLKSVGITSSSYGNLLSSIFMKKIPTDISLIVSRETIKENWDLDYMMTVIELEVEAREIAMVESCSGYRKPSREPPTELALSTKGLLLLW